MTIAEIKKEALRLMYAAMRDVDASEIPDLEGDSLVGDLLGAMTGAINRCLADLERRLALLPVRVEVEHAAWEHTASVSRIPLARLSDAYAVLSVSAENEEGYVGELAFALEGDVLVLPRVEEGTRVSVICAPRAVRVGRGENAIAPRHLPETLAALVPYFIKGDLFYEEEPAEAEAARAIYETGVREYLARTSVGGTLGGGRVGTVYSQVTL